MRNADGKYSGECITEYYCMCNYFDHETRKYRTFGLRTLPVHHLDSSLIMRVRSVAQVKKDTFASRTQK